MHTIHNIVSDTSMQYSTKMFTIT